MRGRTKEYIFNTAILFVGKFTTQFMTFLLIPLYTHYLKASDYGFVDMLQTYISLLIPVLTLRLDSAAFRYLVEVRNKKKKEDILLSSIINSLLLIVFIIICVFLILSIFIKFKYIYLTIINIIVIMLSNVLLQIARGMGKNKEYSIACILTGVVSLTSNLLLVIKYSFGGSAILICSSLANIACVIYLFFALNLKKKYNPKYNDKKKVKEMLHYSIPMIPNSISWWIVNASDRALITLYIGNFLNGIYSIASKFSSIINCIFMVFNMSWQETASLHINDEDSDDFFSKIISQVLVLFVTISVLILSALSFTFNIFIGEEYIGAYNYIPILIFANILNIFSELIGGIYIAKKDTFKLSITTCLAAVINIIINVVFIKKYGLLAASLSTLVSYLVMLIYRYIDVKKYVKIRLNFISIFASIVIMSLVIASYYFLNEICNIVLFIFVLIISIVLNFKIIKQLFPKNMKN